MHAHTYAVISDVWQVLTDRQDSSTENPNSLAPLVSTDVISQGKAVLPQDGVQLVAGVAQLEDKEAEKGQYLLGTFWTGLYKR